MDARIEGQYSLVGAVRAATIAVKCLSTEPKVRPSMDEVVEALEQLQDLKNYGSVRSESVKREPEEERGFGQASLAETPGY
ncbi:hypothetical protein RJ639_040614 [Escallonia herrerae]|uniref:Uncharacterized protein n=1 Tax=Escallonia herrerae TaxID=1293975 RepID=A0AA88WGX0_9ASTE|nr:hypothetical protein RJ639_040614 [Escallonia herrerae]